MEKRLYGHQSEQWFSHRKRCDETRAGRYIAENGEKVVWPPVRTVVLTQEENLSVV